MGYLESNHLRPKLQSCFRKRHSRRRSCWVSSRTDMMLLIWCHWYDAIDVMPLIRCHWYDAINMMPLIWCHWFWLCHSVTSFGCKRSVWHSRSWHLDHVSQNLSWNRLTTFWLALFLPERINNDCDHWITLHGLDTSSIRCSKALELFCTSYTRQIWLDSSLHWEPGSITVRWWRATVLNILLKQLPVCLLYRSL